MLNENNLATILSPLLKIKTSFNKDLKLGSIHNTTIHKAWNSEKMREIRDIHKKGEFFKDKTCNDCVNLIYPPKAN